MIKLITHRDKYIYINPAHIIAVSTIFIQDDDPSKGSMDYVRVRTIDKTDFDLNEDIAVVMARLEDYGVKVDHNYE